MTWIKPPCYSFTGWCDDTAETPLASISRERDVPYLKHKACKFGSLGTLIDCGFDGNVNQTSVVDGFFLKTLETDVHFVNKKAENHQATLNMLDHIRDLLNKF